MDNPAVIPIRDPLSQVVSRELDAVAGSDIEPAHSGDANVPGISEAWLDQVAESLSEHGWMSLDTRDRLGAGLLAALREEVVILDRTDAMKSAGIGRGSDLVRDRAVRRDRIAWLQGITPPQAELFRFLESIRSGLNQRLFLGLKRFETHYATYHPGDFYKRHLDSFRGRASRVVSLVLYLNDDWAPGDGGALQVFNRDNENEVCGIVVPEAGRMALFLSEEIPHEVLPANRTRYSLACWFRQDEVPLPL
ncbi:2OG-Fe(II) oxygenase [Marinobacter pelagius]|uniref:2OG-Fe(II) oxygenase n=1 Tax=Marinobacter sp. C7 TaxID=2951363 RepID=UPI001EF0A9DC|nr:2OG-Fe(II) oxygenase [Marinobacter sp. C7]MCG7199491.1 2OG-Fe(II) oxygenase [Marinobacter sp. C7]